MPTGKDAKKKPEQANQTQQKNEQLQKTVQKFPAIKNILHQPDLVKGAMALGTISPKLGADLLLGAKLLKPSGDTFKSISPNKGDVLAFHHNVVKGSEKIAKQAMTNALPQQQKDNAAKPFNPNVARFQTQLPGIWDLGKTAVKQQFQEDYYGTKALPNDQQTVLKNGLEWAQHQYQSGQQQAKTWETQLRQSEWGRKIAPVWDDYQKADRKANALSRDFAKSIDPTIRSWTDKGYDLANQPLNFVDDKTKNIPIIGTLSHAVTDTVRSQLQVSTGIIKWGGGFVGGLASLATDPVSALKGIGTIAEHIPPAMLLSNMGGSFVGSKVLNQLGVPMVNPLKAMHGAYDVVVNGEDYNTRMSDRVFDPKKSMAEDTQVLKAVANGLIEPIKKSWEQGKPVEAITQGVLEVVSFFVGAGEAKAGFKLGEIGKVASDADKVADVSNATKIAEGANTKKTAREADLIAQLGGFLAHKGDGEPGLKTLWRGIGVLHGLIDGVQLAPRP